MLRMGRTPAVPCMSLRAASMEVGSCIRSNPSPSQTLFYLTRPFPRPTRNLQSVACSLFAVSIFLNCPIAFLDFLLSIPWQDAGKLYPAFASATWGEDVDGAQPPPPPPQQQQPTQQQQQQPPLPMPAGQEAPAAPAGASEGAEGGGGAAGAWQLDGGGPGGGGPDGGPGSAWLMDLVVSPEHRSALVNVRMDSKLIDCVLDFLYTSSHVQPHLLPPMVRTTALSWSPGDPLTAAHVSVRVLVWWGW